jgi:hypothetical protein
VPLSSALIIVRDQSFTQSSVLYYLWGMIALPSFFIFQLTNYLCRSDRCRSQVFSLHPLERVWYGSSIPSIFSYVLTNSIYLVDYDEGTRVLVSCLDELLMRIVELACALLYNAGLNSPLFGMLSSPPSPSPPFYISHTLFSSNFYKGY